MEDITFSLFKGYADTLPADATLSEIIRMIRQDPTVKLHTLKHRYYASQGNAAAADKEKSSCPCFSVAVRFQGGKRKRHICGWTSVGLVDIDHLEKAALPELLKRIVADPHTLLTYTTISGAGIRILYRVEHDENTLQRAVASPLDEDAYLASEAHYRAAFLLANDYYARLLGVECDLKCKNSTRLCGLAHDPELFFNPDALPLRAEVVPKIRKRMRNYRLERAVTTARKELEAQGVTYEPHQHNDYIMRMGYLLNRYGIDQDQATEWALNTFTGYDGDIAGIFRSCYLQTEEFGTKVPTTGKNHARQPLAGVAEIEDFLSGQGSFRRNVITGKYEVDFTRENREEDFRAPDLEADQIQTYFRRPLPGEAAVFITTAQIISRISGGIRQLMSPAKVNQLMKKLGFEAVRSGNKRGYLVVELTLDQVNQNRSALGHYLRDECCSES